MGMSAVQANSTQIKMRRKIVPLDIIAEKEPVTLPPKPVPLESISQPLEPSNKPTARHVSQVIFVVTNLLCPLSAYREATAPSLKLAPIKKL